jgi:hypothetical protein
MKRSAFPFVRGRYGRVNRWRMSSASQALRCSLLRQGGPVVGHQPLDGDALAGEPGDGVLQKRGDGLLALVIEDLDIGQTGAVVDADVDELPADPPAARAAVTADPMPRAPDPPELLDVDVDQLTGHRALIAIRRLGLLHGRQLRQAQAGDDPADSALGHPQRLGDRHRAHPHLAAQLGDQRLALRARAPRHPPRGSRPAIRQLAVASAPPTDPLTSARLAEAGRLSGRPQRPPLLTHPTSQQLAALRTRLGVAMQYHSGTSSARLRVSQPAASEEART